MAITIAAKFEYDIPTQAEAMGIPTNVLKVIIRKLFGMATFGLIPDAISFIEQSKAYPEVIEEDGSVLEALPVPRLLLNGEDTLVIGLRDGEGTDVASLQTYIDKAYVNVVDLSTWKA